MKATKEIKVKVKDIFIVNYSLKISEAVIAIPTKKVLLYKTYEGDYYLDTNSKEGVIAVSFEDATKLLNN